MSYQVSMDHNMLDVRTSFTQKLVNVNASSMVGCNFSCN